jgi:hypothetical protein
MDTDLVKLSTDWAKAEVFSGKIVWLFSVIYIATAIGFLYLGRTAMAKAFVWPFLVAGIFLIAVGSGLFFTNQPRIAQFEKEYHQNPEAFVQQEIQRTAESQKQLALVFRILPAMIIIAAIVILCLPESQNWRAIGIIVIATATFLTIVDSNTDSRNTIYHSRLSASKP